MDSGASLWCGLPGILSSALWRFHWCSKVHCQRLLCWATHMQQRVVWCGKQYAGQSLIITYVLWESDLCNQQVVSMSPLQNGISLLLILSMEIMEFHGLMISLCLVSSWTWSILNTVDNWAQAVLVGHLILASILIVLHVAYIFWVPNGCHEFGWGLSHIFCWEWQFVFLLGWGHLL